MNELYALVLTICASTGHNGAGQCNEYAIETMTAVEDCLSLAATMRTSVHNDNMMQFSCQQFTANSAQDKGYDDSGSLQALSSEDSSALVYIYSDSTQPDSEPAHNSTSNNSTNDDTLNQRDTTNE